MNEDIQLSEHFSFQEMTATSNAALQEKNRAEALKYLPTARALATTLLEPIRGGSPLVVNSAFRCGELNGATPGSSPTSQHMTFQAADLHRPGQSIDEFFAEALAILKSERIAFGQLIDEECDRGYSVSRWVHVSLGPAFWKPERCGEVLRMRQKPGEKQVWTLLEKVPVLKFPSAD